MTFNQNLPAYDYRLKILDSIGVGSVDLQLLSQIAHHDQEAFAELYQRYAVPLYNYLYNLVRDQHIAEDLLQEVFVAVWNGAHRFRGHSLVKTWLFHIAHNQAVSWLRQKRQATHIDELDHMQGEGDLESQVLETCRNTQMRQAIDQLSPSHREVVELAFFHGLSYNEIAEVISVPVGTVKSRMTYARRYLGALLSELTPENGRS